MAYGDNRSELASDTFATEVSTSWDNGPSNWSDCTWISANLVRPSALGQDCAITRNAESYTNDQYSTITALHHTTNTQQWLGAVCRHQGTSNPACYIGMAWNNSTYDIYEVSAAFGFTELATTAWGGSPLASGETVTLEAEGTTLRMGSAEGGGDTERLSTTDATLGSGTVGVALFNSSASLNSRCSIQAWAGGNIAVAGGYNAAPLLHHYRAMKRGGVFH